MSYIVPDEELLQTRTKKFLKRIFVMRQLGTILCFFPIFSVLRDMHYESSYFILLAVNAFVWPSFAYLISQRSGDPVKTEQTSLIVDTMFGGAWIGVMGLSPMPSFIILAVFIADRYAAGGWKLLAPSILGFTVSLIGVWLLVGMPLTLTFSPHTVWLTIPLATLYLIALSILSRKLSTNLSQKNRQFERIALMDPRLHIPNRRLFEQRLASTFVQTQRGNSTAHLMLIDVDHFKDINDTYGHEMGDYVLIELSNILRESIQSKDIPARFGGDEFAVIVMDSSSQEIMQLSQTILDKVRHFRLPSNPDFRMSISIGISSAAAAGSTTDWLKMADQALYEVKRQGRDGVQYICEMS
ncbi:diguanylate cyclase [Acinetobacter sp. ANC 4178]|uniref:diguanylate cyclase n=1 Tax=Acinetobacter sp. ANC 4178 TaxID=2529839 RepID=UPI00103B52D4|nr:diguanylate cyclase [Acinetobacter sp. ANC 4178]TCB65845.1 diguanylate cyclase [Acinetobacter sp. ANC 4178]